MFGTTWYHKLQLPGVAEFVKRWQTAYPQSPIPVPGNVSYNGYMATRELLRAIERAGSTNNITVIKAARRPARCPRPTACSTSMPTSIRSRTRCSRRSISPRRNTKPADKTDLFEIISWTKPKAALDDAAPAKCKLKPYEQVPTFDA